MKISKKELILISQKVSKNKKLTPSEINTLLSFNKSDDESKVVILLKKGAVPIALFAGFLIAIFPTNADTLAKSLPNWTNLTSPLQNGLNYIWNIIGEPVEKTNIIFHFPNIILYSFGFLGIKKLFDALEKRTWIDKVLEARSKLYEEIENGTSNLNLSKGHSILFTGNGDFIASQFVKKTSNDKAVVISTKKPEENFVWNYYDHNTSYENLKTVLERVSDKDTGEYIFFPVKDDQVFLPGPLSYDLSPHKIDILCQDIRSIEKENKWKMRKIILVGDKYHKSFVQSEDIKGKIKNSEDSISLDEISKKYNKISVLDPTDIVINKIIEIAKGRKIVFRATHEGIKEYKKRFYERLLKNKYKESKNSKGILTIGYDILEDQTEQQTLTKKIDDYLPVVLSQPVKDALIRNGYRKDEFIFVPELVLEELKKEAQKQ